MSLLFAAGPANLSLRLLGYQEQTQSAAERYFSQFPPRRGLPTWSGALRAEGAHLSHRGDITLEMGPVGSDGSLSYPDRVDLPLRLGAPRAILHGTMGLIAHHLRRHDGRLLHAAARRVPGFGAVIAIGESGAGKSTLTQVIDGDEMGDETVALTTQGDQVLARATVLPGERLASHWDAEPVAAILVPAHHHETELITMSGDSRLTALTNAIIRLRGDQVFDDFDWSHRVLKQIPILRVRWSLSQCPNDDLRRWLDASS